MLLVENALEKTQVGLHEVLLIAQVGGIEVARERVLLAVEIGIVHEAAHKGVGVGKQRQVVALGTQLAQAHKAALGDVDNEAPPSVGTLLKGELAMGQLTQAPAKLIGAQAAILKLAEEALLGCDVEIIVDVGHTQLDETPA